MQPSIIKTLVRGILKLFFRFRVIGPVPDFDSQALIVANHASNWDALAIYAIMPEDATIVSKIELKRVPILGWILQHLNVIFVDRESNDLHALRDMLSVLQEGRTLALFPEGTRLKEPDPLQMHDGVAYLVQKSKATIYPVYLDTDYRLRGSFEVHFRRALPYSTFEGLDRKTGRKEIVRRVYNAIYATDLPIPAFQKEQD